MSKARDKGTKFETAVVNFLNESGELDVQRTGSRSFEAGDLENVPGFAAVECKNQQAMSLAGWVDQVVRSRDRLPRQHRSGDLVAVIHKRKGKNVREAYVTMPLHDFRVVLNDLAGFDL